MARCFAQDRKTHIPLNPYNFRTSYFPPRSSSLQEYFPLLKGTLYPRGKCWFGSNFVAHCVLCHFYWIRFFNIFQVNPRLFTILSLYLKLPSLNRNHSPFYTKFCFNKSFIFTDSSFIFAVSNSFVEIIKIVAIIVHVGK